MIANQITKVGKAVLAQGLEPDAVDRAGRARGIDRIHHLARVGAHEARTGQRMLERQLPGGGPHGQAVPGRRVLVIGLDRVHPLEPGRRHHRDRTGYREREEGAEQQLVRAVPPEDQGQTAPSPSSAPRE